MSAYDDLARLFARLRAIHDATGILGWDAQALMPAGAADGRTEQLATLRGLAHDLLTEPRTGDLLLEAAAEEHLGPWKAANLREMRRVHAHAAAVPHDLVAADSRATSRAEMAWREARAAGDFTILAPHLRDVLDAQREIGRCKGEALGLSPYDALLDQFDPGMRQARIDPIFDRLRTELPGLLRDAEARQRADRPPSAAIEGRYPVAAQRDLGETLMRRLGFDFERGRLDTSLHPFCGGATDDVRITTRYDEEDFSRALMGVLHETGHALYEQGRPRSWLQQPVGEARGMVMHESQSLLVEMQACRTREFLGFLAPLARAAFGHGHAALDADALHRHYTRVQAGFIRVDADEVTYPAHILLRTDLERAMIAGELEVSDLPGAFDEGMRDLLGLVVTDDARGCLQDIHWPSGAWGYFPTYTLGAIAAAQLFAAASAAVPDLLPDLAKGEFGRLVAWLREEVHGKGSLLDTDDLMRSATGRPLEIDPYLAHLRRRYVVARS